MTKDIYNIIIDAMYYKDITDKDGQVVRRIPVYRDELDEQIKDDLFHGIQQELATNDNIPFEQSYHIMYEALALFDGIEYADIGDFDPLECGDDIASVYYAEQLGYLNTDNMYAISDIMREYECESIADACAIWYNDTVKDWALAIKNYITGHD